MLQEKTNATGRTMYLRIKGGAIIMKTKEGEEKSFGSISGSIKKIELKTNEFEGKKFVNWHIVMEDYDNGETYDLAADQSSNAFAGIVRSLASEEGMANLDDITIEVYMSKNNYTNATVKTRGERIHWIEEPMPAVKKVMVGTKEVVDDSEKIAWISKLVEKINTKIASGDADQSRQGFDVEDVDVDDLPD